MRIMINLIPHDEALSTSNLPSDVNNFWYLVAFVGATCLLLNIVSFFCCWILVTRRKIKPQRHAPLPPPPPDESPAAKVPFTQTEGPTTTKPIKINLTSDSFDLSQTVVKEDTNEKTFDAKNYFKIDFLPEETADESEELATLVKQDCSSDFPPPPPELETPEETLLSPSTTKMDSLLESSHEMTTYIASLKEDVAKSQPEDCHLTHLERWQLTKRYGNFYERRDVLRVDKVVSKRPLAKDKRNNTSMYKVAFKALATTIPAIREEDSDVSVWNKTDSFDYETAVERGHNNIVSNDEEYFSALEP